MATTKKNENFVTLSLEEYNQLRDELVDVNNENNELRNAIVELQDADGQKVIIKTVTVYDDGEQVDVSIKNLDDAVAMLNGELKATNDALTKKCESLEKANKDFAEATIKLDMEISRLKHRNLWQRIWNK